MSGTRPCIVCGALFEPKHAAHRCCSQACRRIEPEGWRPVAERFVAGLMRWEQDLQKDIARAKDQRLRLLATDLLRLRTQVQAARGDCEALLRATAYEVNQKREGVQT